MPRVSICIPAYKPEYFELTLRSALAQSYTDTEIIVSDDCPSEAIKEICARYPGHVQYSRNQDPGEYKNVIRLASMATGEYIKYLFDDDVLHPFCVQYLVETMDSGRAAGAKIAFSPRYFINETNQLTGLGNGLGMQGEVKLIGGDDFIRMTAMRHHNLLGEFSTVLLRTEDCFDQDGNFNLFKVVDGIISGPLDLSAWIGLSQRGALIGHPMPLSFFRQHSNSQSSPASNRYFIYSITYYEEVLELATAKGIVTGADLPVAYQNLHKHYAYWAASFPELNERMARIRSRLSA